MSNQTSEAFAYIEREYKDAKGRVELQRSVVEQLHMAEANAVTSRPVCHRTVVRPRGSARCDVGHDSDFPPRGRLFPGASLSRPLAPARRFCGMARK
jgi:hypothetical protein